MLALTALSRARDPRWHIVTPDLWTFSVLSLLTNHTLYHCGLQGWVCKFFVTEKTSVLLDTRHFAAANCTDAMNKNARHPQLFYKHCHINKGNLTATLKNPDKHILFLSLTPSHWCFFSHISRSHSNRSHNVIMHAGTCMQHHPPACMHCKYRQILCIQRCC